MRILLITIVLAVGAFAGVLSQFYIAGITQPNVPDLGGKPVEPAPEQVAANGVVEGAHPEAALRLEVPGTIAVVHVHEGQEVQTGALLLELSNDTQKQQVALAKADLAVARAELERLRNGERAEKRKAAAALEESRRVLLQHAEADRKRSQMLIHTNAATREQFDNDHFKVLRTKADVAEAAAQRALVEAPPRAEDVAIAEGKVAAAEAKLHLAETDLAKTRLLARSPGLILQVHAELGELATPTSAQPLVTMADLSHLRVRAFIEELDAGRVRVGQRAVITADGYPDQKFTGTASRLIPRMGKRAPQTDQANEYKDMYYREVLIDLDSTTLDLPVNLRVQVRINADTPAHGQRSTTSAVSVP